MEGRLCITLKKGETIVFDDGTVICLTKVTRGTARLWMQADGKRILRGSILEPEFLQRVMDGEVGQAELNKAFDKHWKAPQKT